MDFERREDFQRAFRAVIADRHSPDARALLLTVSQYVERRVRWFGRNRASDLFGEAELEELVGEVLLQLMAGSLAQFRGGSLPELLAFVRTVTDRCAWRTARKRIDERQAMEAQERPKPAELKQSIDENVLLRSEPVLDERDCEYLVALLQAGSKAEYARQAGVSRAAVTKRVERIRNRIELMPSGERQAAEAWVSHAARVVTGMVS